MWERFSETSAVFVSNNSVQFSQIKNQQSSLTIPLLILSLENIID